MPINMFKKGSWPICSHLDQTSCQFSMFITKQILLQMFLHMYMTGKSLSTVPVHNRIIISCSQGVSAILANIGLRSWQYRPEAAVKPVQRPLRAHILQYSGRFIVGHLNHACFSCKLMFLQGLRTKGTTSVKLKRRDNFITLLDILQYWHRQTWHRRYM